MSNPYFFAMKQFLPLFFLFSSTWVFAQSFSSSNLPIVIIETDGRTIFDEPKIDVRMKIIYNGPNKRNNLTDTPNDYDGIVGIEYRGSTSQQLFPKKPYGFETRDAQGNGIDVSILGFPKEQDWILYPSYNEKTFLHNVMAMKMARDMGIYGSRTQHVEVVLNGRYDGVYVLMEKIKRNSGRVDIAKLTETENAGDDLTGGYIFKIDKNTGSSGTLGWTSKVAPPQLAPPTIANSPRTYYYYEYPKAASITYIQQQYLRAVVDTAEAVLNGSKFNDPVVGYKKYFEPQSFAKYFLLNEVSKNVDGYRISTFFYKDKNSKDRRIKAGPPWDYDLAFGNADYCEGYNYTGWSYLFGQVCPNDFWQVPFHWKKMMEDDFFVGSIYSEYQRLRTGVWKTEKLHGYIDSLATVLNESQQRNFVRWPVIGQYVWPNPKPVPATWQAEISYFKSWLAARLDWLDHNIPGRLLASEPLINSNAELKISAAPNPFVDHLNLKIEAPRRMEVLLEVFDMTGRLVQTKIQLLENGLNQTTLPMNTASGQYILRVHSPTEVTKLKIVKE